MPQRSLVKRVVRRAVLRYSIRNRRRKASDITSWMDRHGCRDVLLVGTSGDEQAGNADQANAGIVEKRLAERFRIRMGVNIHPAVTSYPFQLADARDLPFEDDYVDFALANAIIEHVGDEPDQRRMVEEMTRVARCWVITTPNRWFPVESHTSVPFLHWSPAWRARHRAQFTRLLSRRQLQQLLPPGAEIVGRAWSPTFTAYYDRALAPVRMPTPR
jgi:hypothetical protein